MNATIRHRGSSIEVRCDDHNLTSQAGMVLVSTLIERLEVIETVDEMVGPIKQRDRGLSAGEFIAGKDVASALAVAAGQRALHLFASS